MFNLCHFKNNQKHDNFNLLKKKKKGNDISQCKQKKSIAYRERKLLTTLNK